MANVPYCKVTQGRVVSHLLGINSVGSPALLALLACGVNVHISSGGRGIAKPGIALAWGARDPGFKSQYPDHRKKRVHGCQVRRPDQNIHFMDHESFAPIELIARAVCVKENKLLLCKAKNINWYYFPGGHVEFGEPAKAALARELKEELGVTAEVQDFLGAAENAYQRDGTVIHELNLVFACSVPDTNLQSRESHLEFFWISLDDARNVSTKPEHLAKAVLAWIENPKPFWVDIALS